MLEAGEADRDARVRRFVLRYYSVFNSEQCDLPASETEKLALPVEKPIDPIAACEEIVANMPNPPSVLFMPFLLSW